MQCGYKFTQYIEELAAMLNDGIETLVLCNLLNTLCGYGSLTPKTLNGKEYHFYRSKESICKDELYIDVQKYNRAVKRLENKGLIKTFQGRNPKEKMRKITYNLINENYPSLYFKGVIPAYCLKKRPKKDGLGKFSSSDICTTVIFDDLSSTFASRITASLIQ